VGDVRSAAGLAVRFARERAHLTQDQLAQRTGVAKSHISRIEGGLVDPGVGVVTRLAEGLGMTFAELSAEIDAERKRSAKG
jgi:transcriptional regulator with XRE-family HTH domain